MRLVKMAKKHDGNYTRSRDLIVDTIWHGAFAASDTEAKAGTVTV